jgi:hypothetical protein
MNREEIWIRRIDYDPQARFLILPLYPDGLRLDRESGKNCLHFLYLLGCHNAFS